MNSQRPDTDDYRALFLQHTPMMDMRAPVEFVQGSFPSALNLPLMTDEEREQVGICYKENGQQAAIALGHSLVQGTTKNARMEQWLAFAARFDSGYLYCFRGGLRSQTVQQWLREAGVHYPLVIGGYKAMRRYLLDELERSIAAASFILIAGKTGTGKTRVVERLERCIDLEGLANHRGSSFGQLPNGQPSQIDFENGISIALLRLLGAQQSPVFLEDEGRLIGRLSLPESLRTKMTGAPMVLVEQSLEQRTEVVVEDYVMDLGRRYHLLYAESGAQLHCDKLLADLARIRKRLGGVRYQTVQSLIQAGFEQQWSSHSLDGHRQWISLLLQDYYDPMYEYQLKQRGGRYLFKGDRTAVLEWAAERQAQGAG